MNIAPTSQAHLGPVLADYKISCSLDPNLYMYTTQVPREHLQSKGTCQRRDSLHHFVSGASVIKTAAMNSNNEEKEDDLTHELPLCWVESSTAWNGRTTESKWNFMQKFSLRRHNMTCTFVRVFVLFPRNDQNSKYWSPWRKCFSSGFILWVVTETCTVLHFCRPQRFQERQMLVSISPNKSEQVSPQCNERLCKILKRKFMTGKSFEWCRWDCMITGTWTCMSPVALPSLECRVWSGKLFFKGTRNQYQTKLRRFVSGTLFYGFLRDQRQLVPVQLKLSAKKFIQICPSGCGVICRRDQEPRADFFPWETETQLSF